MQGSSSHLSQSLVVWPFILQCLQKGLAFLSILSLLLIFISWSFAVMCLRSDGLPLPLLFFALGVVATLDESTGCCLRRCSTLAFITPINSCELMFLNRSRVAWHRTSAM